MDLYARYFIPFPVIVTGRLTLRRIERRDLADLYEYCRREDSCRYSEWSPHQSRLETRRYIAWMQRRYADREGLTFAVECEGRVIGTASYIGFDESYGTVEIGYGIRSDYWGRGLGREIVNALVWYAFETVGAQRVSARVLPENTRSAALLTACGFTCEGVHRRSLFLKGKYRDVAVYAKLKEQP